MFRRPHVTPARSLHRSPDPAQIGSTPNLVQATNAALAASSAAAAVASLGVPTIVLPPTGGIFRRPHITPAKSQRWASRDATQATNVNLFTNTIPFWTVFFSDYRPLPSQPFQQQPYSFYQGTLSLLALSLGAALSQGVTTRSAPLTSVGSAAGSGYAFSRSVLAVLARSLGATFGAFGAATRHASLGTTSQGAAAGSTTLHGATVLIASGAAEAHATASYNFKALLSGLTKGAGNGKVSFTGRIAMAFRGTAAAVGALHQATLILAHQPMQALSSAAARAWLQITTRARLNADSAVHAKGVITVTANTALHAGTAAASHATAGARFTTTLSTVAKAAGAGRLASASRAVLVTLSRSAARAMAAVRARAGLATVSHASGQGTVTFSGRIHILAASLSTGFGKAQPLVAARLAVRGIAKSFGQLAPKVTGVLTALRAKSLGAARMSPVLSSYVQGAASGNASGSQLATFSITLPTPVGTGNCLVVGMTWFEPVTAIITDDQGNSYTQIIDYADTADAETIGIFVCGGITNAPKTITARFGGAGGAYLAMAAAEYAGIATSHNPSDGSAVFFTGSTANGTDSVSSGTLTPTSDNDQIVAIAFCETGTPGTVTAGTNETLRVSYTGGTPNVYVADKMPIGTSPVAGTFTLSGSSSPNFVATAVALKPAASPRTVSAKTMLATTSQAAAAGQTIIRGTLALLTRSAAQAAGLAAAHISGPLVAFTTQSLGAALGRAARLFALSRRLVTPPSRNTVSPPARSNTVTPTEE